MPAVTLPKLSDSMEEGTIVRWLVGDGEPVRRGQEIAEIETDKATMTFESEFDGVIRREALEGDTLAVGAVIAQVLAEAENPTPAGPGGAPSPTEGGSSANGGGAAVAAPVAVIERGGDGHQRVKASPVARRMALDLKVDLARMRGSGPQGRVVKRDVVAASPVVDAPAAPAPGPAEPEPTAKGGARTEDLSRAQALIVRRMAEAKATMPDFALTAEVDMDAAVALRGELKALEVEAIPSYNDLVIKACGRALRRHPRANGAYRDGRFELYDRVNVGVAVAARDALVVPTIFDADEKSLARIAAESRRLAAKARDGRLSASELAGGTFTVSNLGMFGISQFTAVLNPPQAAILAVGVSEQRPIARDGRLALGHRMTLTLTCDHRILYGADAAAFLVDIRAELEQPLRLIL